MILQKQIFQKKIKNIDFISVYNKQNIIKYIYKCLKNNIFENYRLS